MPKKQNPERSGSVRGVDFAEVERFLAFMQKHGSRSSNTKQAGVHIRSEEGPGAICRAAFISSVASGVPEAELPQPAQLHLQFQPTRLRRARSPLQKQVLSARTSTSLSPRLWAHFIPRSGPEASPFVTVGAKVESGQVLCIIEAMKLMNEIESDVAGEIVQIFVENGKPVEYGEPLFGIRPHGKK